eukprot:279641-Prorocentrum_minimum.AAC.2
MQAGWRPAGKVDRYDPEYDEYHPPGGVISPPRATERQDPTPWFNVMVRRNRKTSLKDVHDVAMMS